MAQYKGSQADGNRISALNKLRLEKQAEFERQKELIRQKANVGLGKMDEKFQSQDSRIDEQFKRSTVGLVTADEFKRKRLEAEETLRREDAKRKAAHEKEKKKREEQRRKKSKILTFSMEDGEDDDDAQSPAKAESSNDGNGDGDGDGEQNEDEREDREQLAVIAKKPKHFGKNPDAVTHFLPDKQREEEEKRLAGELREDWLKKQEAIKKEVIEVTYSYWDGSGHRRTINVNKGTRIDQFLELCRRDLQDAFSELRACSADSLMYIKEDLIIPHNYTFYDLIVTKARGKSGPLFHFDVHDDIRLVMDSRVEKDESHAGKLVTRAYYERNKHIFPASRWEVYDPSVVWDKYTIKGGEVR